MMFKKPNTVPTPDEFFDIAVKERSGSEVKLLATVINKTFRWGKLWDFISISQFEEATGLSNRSVIDGLRSLEKDGWVQSAYICGHCNSLVDENFLKAIGKDWTKVKNVKCSTCNTNEPPNKWYTASIEGEDLIEHLRGVYKQSKKAFTDNVPAGVMKKVHEGHEVFTGGVMKKVHEQETSLQETIIQETTTKPIVAETQQRDSERPSFPSYRKRLKGDKLQAFNLIAKTFDKVVGKTLLEFVQQSPVAVTGAYHECQEREVNNFSYFTKVFFTHLQKGVKDGNKAGEIDYDAAESEHF